MLKAVIIDSSAMSRDLLTMVLTEGGYSVVGSVHTNERGFALLQKHHPHFVCIGADQVDEGAIVEQIREQMPKMLVFMMSGTLNAQSIQAAMARGVHGFIVKPFNADAVLKSIKNAVLAMIKKQQG